MTANNAADAAAMTTARNVVSATLRRCYQDANGHYAREADAILAALAGAGLAIVDKTDLEAVTDALSDVVHHIHDQEEWADAITARDRLIAVAWPESATADYLRIAGSHPDQLAARQGEETDGR